MVTHHRSDSQMPSRVVVLGSNGFLGRALVARLERERTTVRALGRQKIDLAAPDAAERLATELKAGDVVVILAAITPDKGRGTEPFLANLKMMAACCTAFERRPPDHVVYLSSDAVYPFRSSLIDETVCAEPVDLYGAMHLSRELMLKQAVKAPLAILRPTLIYGAADTHNSYGPNRLRRMARKDGRITLFGEGEETRDHIYVDDAVALIDLAIRHRSAGTLNLATGNSVSFAELARKVAGLFETSIDIVTTPRQNPITYRAFDVTAIHRAFPAFTFTPLGEGLAAAHRGDQA